MGRQTRAQRVPVARGAVLAVGGVLQDPQTALVKSKPIQQAFTQSERAFMAQVVAYARMMGWRVQHDNATNAPRRCPSCGIVRHTPRNAPGLPDLLLIRRPRVVWAELKAQRGRLTDDQRAWIEELRACGQSAYVWRPSDFEEIERVLR